MNQSDEVRPHFKDFFLYVLIILVALIAVVFLSSKNYSTDNNKSEIVPVATSSASPNLTPPAK